MGGVNKKGAISSIPAWEKMWSRAPRGQLEKSVGFQVIRVR